MFYAGAGFDLCGGFFFAVWALICDLEHGHKAYLFPNPVSNICCPLCPANCSNFPWLAADKGGWGQKTVPCVSLGCFYNVYIIYTYIYIYSIYLILYSIK